MPAMSRSSASDSARGLQRGLFELRALGGIDLVQQHGRGEHPGHQRDREQPADPQAHDSRRQAQWQGGDAGEACGDAVHDVKRQVRDFHPSI
jgi:hypothetical protein